MFLDNQAPMHTGCGKMHTITLWVTELEKASLTYKEGTQDPETISDLFKVKQLVRNRKKINTPQISQLPWLILILKANLSHMYLKVYLKSTAS